MPKINPQKKIQKRRTEQEMRNALASMTDMNNARPGLDVDDPDVVLSDVIEELLEQRQLVEEIKATVFSWQVKFQRK